MKHDWSLAGTDERGRKDYACTRCGKHIGFQPHSLDKIVDGWVCPAWPRRREWGHWLSLLLAACFITKRRWAWLVWKLGLVEVQESSCKTCNAREAWLNTLGGRLCSSTRWWAKLAAWLLVRRVKS